MNQLASIVICAFNHENYVGEAIESIFKQDYRPLQLIISDDASRDGTREAIASKLRVIPAGISVIRCDSDTNTGLASTLNRTCALAKGRAVVLLAGDDISEPSRIRLTMEAFSKSPDIQIVWSSYSVIDKDGNFLTKTEGLSAKDRLYGPEDFFSGKAPSILGATCAYSADIFQKFKPLDSGVVQEDVVLPLRCFLIGKGFFLGSPLVRYRTHGGNIHFGGYRETSTQMVARIIRLGPNRLAIAKQKTKDAIQASELGYVLPPSLMRKAHQEIRDAEVELHVAQGAWLCGKAWRIFVHMLLGRLSFNYAGKLFLLYVMPFAYASVLNARIRLKEYIR